VLRRALVAAFRDAHSKAAALAAEAGLTLGQIISIRESTFVPFDVDFDDEGGGGGGGQDRRSREDPTEPGRTQIFGTVYVVFEAG
jgi:uncharacterized protein YggE